MKSKRNSKRSRRPRSAIRGGRRTAEERAMGPKCGNKDDFLTQEPIRPEYAFRLGKACFDIQSLRNYITQNNLNDGHIINDKNPFTRSSFSAQDYVKINKKLVKVGLHTIQKRNQVDVDILKFNKIFNIFVPYGFWTGIGGAEYVELFDEWEDEGRPDPIEYLDAFNNANEMIDMGYSPGDRENVIQQLMNL